VKKSIVVAATIAAFGLLDGASGGVLSGGFIELTSWHSKAAAISSYTQLRCLWPVKALNLFVPNRALWGTSSAVVRIVVELEEALVLLAGREHSLATQAAWPKLLSFLGLGVLALFCLA